MLVSIMTRFDGSDASLEVWVILIVMAILTFFLWRARAAHAAAPGMAAKFQPDDLKVIEGIGPKIEKLLKADGIMTWSKLAKTDPARLQSVLDKAGSRFKMHSPRTWPEQARMADRGEWSALELMQQRLVGGVDDLANAGAAALDAIAQAGRVTPSVVGGGAAKLAQFASDDLKVVEGIGPKIEELLKAGGIGTWSQLAKAAPEQLQSVLDKAGPRFKMHDPKTWSEQAGMADRGEWDKLQEYQDKLQGGRQ